jgi:hypothetical protein
VTPRGGVVGDEIRSRGTHDKPMRFPLTPAGQAGFELVGVPVNLTLQLTRRERSSITLRWNILTGVRNSSNVWPGANK